MIIYENIITDIGNLSEELGGDFVILFGENAPSTLKDYCYIVEVKKAQSEIRIGDSFFFDDDEFKIIAIGDIAQRNLEELGHVTINFKGDETILLPGTIIVSEKERPCINVGTKIIIKRNVE